MTDIEIKGKELIDEIVNLKDELGDCPVSRGIAIQAALICVREVLKVAKFYDVERWQSVRAYIEGSK